MIKKRTSKKSDILLQMMGGLDFGFIHIGDAILAEIDDERHVAIGPPMEPPQTDGKASG